MATKDGFKIGSGCFKCSLCGKLTRRTNSGNQRFCVKCDELTMHENTHADNNFKDDMCGDPYCPVKDYTKDQRWWLK